jgi:hypothetical protein
MVAKLLPAVAAGLVAFLVSALSHQFARGFEDGVLVSGGGTALTIVGSGWGWLAGVVIVVIAAAAATLVVRWHRIAWLGFAATVLALAVVGVVIRVVTPAAETGPPAPALWLIDGAAEPLTWAMAGIALALGLRTPAPR